MAVNGGFKSGGGAEPEVTHRIYPHLSPIMRLINTKTLKLGEFSGKDVPPYAILSHTWGDGEVSFQDMQDEAGKAARKKPGYLKIERCCAIAAQDGFEYAWVDTCCIDKTSSSELSEAINSMYRWYQEAEICYAYLTDVSSQTDPSTPAVGLASSRWFSRGWTLQELIAPSNVIFYATDWNDIGTKRSLRKAITDITGIHAEALLPDKDPQVFSVAQRMSWAAQRETTRSEDLAYCLMGLFGVNMPMLYGEGDRAFQRLQEEIIRNSDDPTIFAWRTTTPGEYSGRLLANSPAPFLKSRNIVRSKDRDSTSFNLTNKGLHITLDAYRLYSPTYYGVLDCHELGKSHQLLGIHLREESGTEEYYYRARPGHLETITGQITFESKSIYVRDVWQESDASAKRSAYNTWLVETYGLKRHGIEITEIHPEGIVQVIGTRLEVPREFRKLMAVRFVAENGRGKKDTCVVILLATLGVVSADFITPSPDVDLQNVFYTYGEDNSSPYQRTWEAQPDRIVWQLPVRKDWISVSVRKQIVEGKKTQVVNISHGDVVDSTFSSQRPEKIPKNLREAILRY